MAQDSTACVAPFQLIACMAHLYVSQQQAHHLLILRAEGVCSACQKHLCTVHPRCSTSVLLGYCAWLLRLAQSVHMPLTRGYDHSC